MLSLLDSKSKFSPTNITFLRKPFLVFVSPDVDGSCFISLAELIGQSQWDTYVKKLRAIGFAAKLVSQRNEPIQIKECNGIVISPGSKPISLDTPTVLEIEDSNNIGQLKKSKFSLRNSSS